jgi:hypothetical protein
VFLELIRKKTKLLLYFGQGSGFGQLGHCCAHLGCAEPRRAGNPPSGPFIK